MSHPTRIGEVGERALLQRLSARIAPGEGVVVGIGDDAAAVLTDALTLVTTDCLVEGVHFRREFTRPHLLGRKVLSVNLSDIAAMGGVSRYALVNLCLPSDLPVRFLDELYDGLLERAAETGVQVVGGNLSASTGGIVVDLTLLGSGEPRLRRSGARAGDWVVVTGTLGAAAAGLQYLQQGFRLDPAGRLLGPIALPERDAAEVASAISAQLDPAPPLTFGAAVAAAGLSSCGMDLSDGLSGDLLTLCAGSGVSAAIDPRALPVDPGAARLGEAGLQLALHGGEDYQLLLGVGPDHLGAMCALANARGLLLSVIGKFEPGPPGIFIPGDRGRVRLAARAHQHFQVTLAAEEAGRA